MLSSTPKAGSDPLCQELLPSADDFATSAAEEEEEIEDFENERENRRPTHTNPGNGFPDEASPSATWGVMGSLLGRLTRSSSSSTCSSSGGLGGDQPCTLISVDRLGPAGGSRASNSEYSAPIVGYEVMEERARFTVFKVLVQHKSTGRHWFVFRRYTDFARLNRKLRSEYRGLRFSLPPKRWLGDNFDPIFLEERLRSLQDFVDNIVAHTDISKCAPVKEFFCLDDPPGPDDSLEESKILCENLEDAVIQLQEAVRQKDREVTMLKTEVSSLKAQQQALLKSLKLQSRLASVACAQMQDDQQAQMGGDQSKTFLTQMQKVNQFNIALAKTIDRSIKFGSLSDFGSRLSLSKVEEENASFLTAPSSIFVKAASMDDICSRSTGDGSTGSQERLPPLGQVSQDPRSESTKYIITQCKLSTSQTDATTIDILPGDEDLKSCSRDLNSVSFKKLLENSPDLSDSKLPNGAVHNQTVVTLSSIPIAST